MNKKIYYLEKALFCGVDKERDDIERFECTSVSDGYHTMDELYDHRRALTAALLNTLHTTLSYIEGRSLRQFKSKLHNDGTMFEGYFICGIYDQYKNKTHLTYHYALEYWNDFRIPELNRAPEYDGHTSNDVIERLMKL